MEETSTAESAEINKSCAGGGGEEKVITVLVVDDDPIIRMIHSGLVVGAGGTAFRAENGEEAVNLHRTGSSFDLVLMDYEMPIMDGPSATKELRGMGVTSMIVGLTSLGDDEGKWEAFMEAGLNQCLGKPLNIEDVTSLFNQLKKHV